MTPEPYFDGTSWWYSKRTWLHSQQTKKRAATNRRTKELAELERLRRLGADQEWLDRVGKRQKEARKVDAPPVVFEDGLSLAHSAADGTLREIAPGEDPGEGWHVVTWADIGATFSELEPLWPAEGEHDPAVWQELRPDHQANDA